MTRRADQKARTQADLVAAANRLFAAKGYDAVTMRDVAKAMGKSTGLIFAHVPDKPALFLLAMGRGEPYGRLRRYLEARAHGQNIDDDGEALVLMADLFGRSET